MSLSIDPASPVPLYYQIAESIRTAIESGSLRPGDALTPLREAAESWGVNVHTVRHAYTSLARDGLLKAHRGARGTRVVADGRRPAIHPRDGTAVDAFLESILDDARLRHGLTPTALADALLKHGEGVSPRIYMVECSQWQAECHAKELVGRYQVDAVPWPLQDGEPPEGTVLATYFHYNDVRRSWPRRLASVRFISIHPDPVMRDVFAGAQSVRVCEMDADTADAVAADLSALFEPGRPEVRTKVAANPNDLAPRRAGRSAPHLFAPRAWAALTDEVRANPHVFELRYVLDRKELESLASLEGWRPSSTHNEGKQS